jgi:hypothetical protein
MVAFGSCGCGTSHPAEESIDLKSAEQVLSKSQWHIQFVKVADAEPFLAGKVMLARGASFRFVVLAGRKALPRALAGLPVPFRALLRPDFGEASLLGESSLLFAADAGRRGKGNQKRYELNVQDELETRLCRASDHSACPAV